MRYLYTVYAATDEQRKSVSSSPAVLTSLRVEVFHFLTWHVVHIRGMVLQEAKLITVIMFCFCARQFPMCTYAYSYRCVIRGTGTIIIYIYILKFYA